MIEIIFNGERVDLPVNFALEISDTNPVLNELGSQSLPVTFPLTRKNIRLFSGLHRVDSALDPSQPLAPVLVLAGGFMRRGLLNVTEVNADEGIVANIGFDNSTAYAEWKNKKLTELSKIPVYYPENCNSMVDRVYAIITYLSGLYKDTLPLDDDLAVFPIAVRADDYSDSKFYEVLNLPGAEDLTPERDAVRLIDGVPKMIDVPDGYALTPFIKVWKVLEMIFDDLNLTISGANPFRNPENPELSLLVVLNNTADTICNGKIDYTDLLPDVTVLEFLNSLWTRFGLVYNIDSIAGTVSLRLIRDIMNENPAAVLDGYQQSAPTISFQEKKYLALKAATSIDGAAPTTERFEDFAKGATLDNIHVGESVYQWRNVGSWDNPDWDGDERENYWGNLDPDDRDPDAPDPIEPDPDAPDPDEPEPEEPDPDDRDPDDYDYYRPAAPEADSFLAREFVSCNWYKLDAVNGVASDSSSPFFVWNPQSSGLQELTIESVDECVPIVYVDIRGSHKRNYYAMTPVFLTGSRHFHTYIKGSDSEENGKTPLAFLFAYTYDGKTEGRIMPENRKGRDLNIKFNNAGDTFTPSISLLFQFKNGLFDSFWKEYDEVLRHANFKIEVSLKLDRYTLSELDMLRPVLLNGCRCLIDSISYDLPEKGDVVADVTLSSIMTRGNYRITDEYVLAVVRPESDE